MHVWNQLEKVLDGQIDVNALQEKANQLALPEREEAEVMSEEVFVNEKSDKKETKDRTVRSIIQTEKSEYTDLEGGHFILAICF